MVDYLVCDWFLELQHCMSAQLLNLEIKDESSFFCITTHEYGHQKELEKSDDVGEGIKLQDIKSRQRKWHA